MGRELRRKQAKKEGKSLTKEEVIEKNPIKKFIIITCSLILIISIIYLGTSLFITKELNWFKKSEDTNTKQESVTNAILASAIFKQLDEEYYVYFYDFNEEKNEITEYVNSKLANEKVYRVNTSSAMNAKYIGEISNKNAKKLEELKVKEPTLIKIKNHEIVKYYESSEITNNI